MQRETFVAILAALLAEVDDASLLEEASSQLAAVRSRLRHATIQRLEVGDLITYRTVSGEEREAPVFQKNRFSVTVRYSDGGQFFKLVIPAERILFSRPAVIPTVTLSPSTRDPELE